MENRNVGCRRPHKDNGSTRVELHKFIPILLFSIFILLCLKLFLAGLYLYSPINVEELKSRGNIINIAKGESAADVVNKLDKYQVISYPQIFRIILRLFNKDNKIHVGEYELTSDMLIIDLINKISSAEVKQYEFRINPNESTAVMLTKLSKMEKLTKTVPYSVKCQPIFNPAINNKTSKSSKTKVVSDTTNLAGSPSEINAVDSAGIVFKQPTDCINLDGVEGLFFPDTYYYVMGDSDYNILQRANNKLNKHLDKLWDTRKVKFDVVSNKLQALILASIVEREASDVYERYLIAGVIYNRLKANMILQMDPTVIYALSLDGKFNGNITKKDLAFDSKYNTYVNKGLPPGPIGPASLESLMAAINPVQHEYLYFVAIGNGKHYFSKTLEEHNKAVHKYQKLKVKYAS